MHLRAFKILCLSVVHVASERICSVQNALAVWQCIQHEGQDKIKTLSQKIPILDPDLNIGSFVLFLFNIHLFHGLWLDSGLRYTLICGEELQLLDVFICMCYYLFTFINYFCNKSIAMRAHGNPR